MLDRLPTCYALTVIERDIDMLLRRFEKLTSVIDQQERRLAAAKAEREQIRERIRVAAGALRNEAPHTPVSASTPKSVIDALAESLSIRSTVEAMLHIGGQVDARWLAKRFNISEQAATIRLSRAFRAGLIERVKKGIYIAPPLTKEARRAQGIVSMDEFDSEIEEVTAAADLESASKTTTTA